MNFSKHEMQQKYLFVIINNFWLSNPITYLSKYKLHKTKEINLKH